MTRQEQAKRWLSLIYPENENIDIIITETIQKMIKVIILKRKSLNMTQNDLAKVTGLTQEAISRLENYTVTPTFPTLEKVVKALDLNFVLEAKDSSEIIDREVVRPKNIEQQIDENHMKLIKKILLVD